VHDCMTTGSTEWGGMAWMTLYPALRSVVLHCAEVASTSSSFDFLPPLLPRLLFGALELRLAVHLAE